MQVIVHAGLHRESGTTSLQDSWRGAEKFADHPAASYPQPPPGPPGHHRLFRPLLRAFTEGLAPDLLGASVAFQGRGGGRQTLADVLEEGRRRGGTLLLSSEDLDRAHEEDRAALDDALAGERVTLVLTATAPMHRWCSGWQTLVKHGLAQYPADAARHIVEFAALRAGRVAKLVDLIPASSCVVRLVRSSPPEPDLAADLAAAVGLPDAGSVTALPVRNASLGTDTEVVLRINRADLALGTDRAGRELLDRLRGSGFAYRDVPGLEKRYAVPDEVLEAAAVGRLAGRPRHPARPPRSARDLDRPGPAGLVPHDQPAGGGGPRAQGAEDRETQLWRARQQRAAYRKGLLKLGADGHQNPVPLSRAQRASRCSSRYVPVTWSGSFRPRSGRRPVRRWVRRAQHQVQVYDRGVVGRAGGHRLEDPVGERLLQRRHDGAVAEAVGAGQTVQGVGSVATVAVGAEQRLDTHQPAPGPVHQVGGLPGGADVQLRQRLAHGPARIGKPFLPHGLAPRQADRHDHVDVERGQHVAVERGEVVRSAAPARPASRSRGRCWSGT